MPKHLLLIDDDDDFLYLTGRRLARLPWVGRIDSVTDGPAALAWFRARLAPEAAGRPELALPDLVLVDIHMPGMGGFELMAALEALLSPHRPRIGPLPRFFLMASSLLDLDRGRTSTSPLVAGFLDKPVEPHALAALVGGEAQSAGV